MDYVFAMAWALDVGVDIDLFNGGDGIMCSRFLFPRQFSPALLGFIRRFLLKLGLDLHKI